MERVIIIDRRETDLLDALKSELEKGKVGEVELEFGDIAIMGNGENGPVSIGIERKKVEDLVNSINSGRLAGHQIPGLINDYDKAYLLIEGEWRGNDISGEIEVKQERYPFKWVPLHSGRKWRENDLWMWLTTMENVGVTVRMCKDMSTTIHTLFQLKSWWTKDWDSHTAHLQMKKAQQPSPFLRTKKYTLLERMAIELPGLGYKRVSAVSERFTSVEDAVLASVEEWMEVEGVGKLTAQNVYNAIRKEEK